MQLFWNTLLLVLGIRNSLVIFDFKKKKKKYKTHSNWCPNFISFGGPHPLEMLLSLHPMHSLHITLKKKKKKNFFLMSRLQWKRDMICSRLTNSKYGHFPINFEVGTVIFFAGRGWGRGIFIYYIYQQKIWKFTKNINLSKILTFFLNF